MFLPPNMTEFICSNASCAASGTSYSTNAKPCKEKEREEHPLVRMWGKMYHLIS